MQRYYVHLALFLLSFNGASGLNSIAHLNNHFAKYGTLVNVQVHFEGDPSSALVTFSSPTEAEAAVNSPEAVLGMRFIRIFLHTEKPANAAFPVPKPSGKTDKVAFLKQIGDAFQWKRIVKT